MTKLNRFVNEYAKYEKGRISRMGISEDKKEAFCKEIDDTVDLCYLGMITIEEAMREITNVAHEAYWSY